MSYAFRGFGNGMSAGGAKLWAGYVQNAPVTVWHDGTITVGAVPPGFAQPVPTGTYGVAELQSMAAGGNVFAGDILATALHYLPKQGLPPSNKQYQPPATSLPPLDQTKFTGGGGSHPTDFVGGGGGDQTVVEDAGSRISKWWYIGLGGLAIGAGLIWWMATRKVHANPRRTRRNPKRRFVKRRMSARMQRQHQRRAKAEVLRTVREVGIGPAAHPAFAKATRAYSRRLKTGRRVVAIARQKRNGRGGGGDQSGSPSPRLARARWKVIERQAREEMAIEEGGRGGYIRRSTQRRLPRRIKKWKKNLAAGRIVVHKGREIGRTAPPKGYPRKRSAYGWPEGYMYPLDTKKRARSAASRFGKHKRRYPAGMRATIAKRLDAAKRRFHIGEYR